MIERKSRLRIIPTKESKTCLRLVGIVSKLNTPILSICLSRSSVSTQSKDRIIQSLSCGVNSCCRTINSQVTFSTVLPSTVKSPLTVALSVKVVTLLTVNVSVLALPTVTLCVNEVGLLKVASPWTVRVPAELEPDPHVR